MCGQCWFTVTATQTAVCVCVCVCERANGAQSGVSEREFPPRGLVCCARTEILRKCNEKLKEELMSRPLNFV